ncbi:MAG: metal-dependent transcriptional regulator [Planctomycetia bacterium]
MATLTVENYVKTIYQLTSDAAERPASTGDLARRLGVSPGSVTSMLRTLADSGLAEYQAYEGVRLSDVGKKLALRVLRRHRLVELFLEKTLGLSWDEVHEEAEHLEHAVSDRLIDRIDAFLRFPDRDPHGDPIPRSDGTVQPIAAEPLSEVPAKSTFVVERVVDQSPDFLRYLTRGGLMLGCRAVVVENHPSAGAVVVRTDGSPQTTLGSEQAMKILVRRDADEVPSS